MNAPQYSSRIIHVCNRLTSQYMSSGELKKERKKASASSIDLNRFSALIVSGVLLLSAPSVSAQNLENGQQLFQSLCARCHGMLGEGSEGPSLTRPNLVHAPDDAALVSVIVGGIPRTSMPDSRQLRVKDGPDVAALGEVPPEEMPDDAVARAQVYRSIGNCSSCHILHGEGTGIGPELINVGQRPKAQRNGPVSKDTKHRMHCTTNSGLRSYHIRHTSSYYTIERCDHDLLSSLRPRAHRCSIANRTGTSSIRSLIAFS
jgi:mono/diheme cytochrome c family protein